MYGTNEVLANYEIEFTSTTWYKFDITYSEKNIEVFLQHGVFRAIKKIFMIEDEGMSRGGVGMATNGKQRTYFDNIKV
jgi:hypothetical protein